MTNLQDGADHHAAQVQQRLLLGLPIGVGALLALVLVGVGVLPQWLKLQSDSERLAQLEEIQGRIPLLRAQIAKTAQSQDAAERKQQKVLQLIEGSGELVTFLAQLDREAARLGVQLDLYEPVVVDTTARASKGQKPDPKAPPPPPVSPLEATGLQSQKYLLTARGSYPNLLAFMRAVESMDLLVVQSNLALSVVEQPKETSTPAKPVVSRQPSTAKTELKLALTYYQTPDPAPATPPVKTS